MEVKPKEGDTLKQREEFQGGKSDQLYHMLSEGQIR